MTARFSPEPPLTSADPEHLSKGWPARRPPSPARDAVYAALRTKAARTAVAVARARAYALRPRALDALGDDLSSLPPKHLVTALEYIARNSTPHRWVGFGGEVPAINLKGAILYARYLRAKANHLVRRAAA